MVDTCGTWHCLNADTSCQVPVVEHCTCHAKGTFVDAVLRDVDVHPSLNGSTLDVLQLLHCLLAHMLQLADMIIHIGNLNLACCACAPSCHLTLAIAE